MRKVILPLFLAALPAFAFASGPAKMLVVVHSSDRIVYNYVCNTNNGAGADATVFRTEVRSKGGFSWHVVGGVAPFRVLRNEPNTMNGCITVMDAEGQVATGCSMVGVQQIRVAVDCQGMQPLDDGPYGLVPNDSTDAARTGSTGKKPLSPIPTEFPPVRNSPPPHPPVGDGPDIGYHPPVKFPSPSPDGPPPVKPCPNDVVKERSPAKVPHTRPRPQPRVTNPKHASPAVKTTHSTRPTGTSPRPSAPPTPRTPAKTNSTW